MTVPSGRTGHERFQRLYSEHARPVLGYALRRTDRPEDAADVVAETFLVALRRITEIPPEPDARPWLYGVARRVLANQRRGDLRRSRLGDRLRSQLGAAVEPDPADEVAGGLDATRLLAQLGDRDREVLELSAWEGLEPREIAAVLGVSANSVRLRLSRVRRRLRSEIGTGSRHDGQPLGHLLDEPADPDDPARAELSTGPTLHLSEEQR